MKYLILIIAVTLCPPSFAQFNFHHGMLVSRVKAKLTLSCTNFAGVTEELNTELQGCDT